MDNQQILDQISNMDRVFGRLCHEAENSYQNENYFAALACLFVITEQIIKYSLDKIDGNYHECLITAEWKKIISEDEFKLLNDIRSFRNNIFHKNHYSSGVEINGKYFPFDEDETKKIIYNKFSQAVFILVEKIILNNNV